VTPYVICGRRSVNLGPPLGGLPTVFLTYKSVVLLVAGCSVAEVIILLPAYTFYILSHSVETALSVNDVCRSVFCKYRVPGTGSLLLRHGKPEYICYVTMSRRLLAQLNLAKLNELACIRTNHQATWMVHILFFIYFCIGAFFFVMKLYVVMDIHILANSPEVQGRTAGSWCHPRKDGPGCRQFIIINSSSLMNSSSSSLSSSLSSQLLYRPERSLNVKRKIPRSGKSRGTATSYAITNSWFTKSRSHEPTLNDVVVCKLVVCL